MLLAIALSQLQISNNLTLLSAKRCYDDGSKLKLRLDDDPDVIFNLKFYPSYSHFKAESQVKRQHHAQLQKQPKPQTIQKILPQPSLLAENFHYNAFNSRVATLATSFLVLNNAGTLLEALRLDRELVTKAKTLSVILITIDMFTVQGGSAIYSCLLFVIRKESLFECSLYLKHISDIWVDVEDIWIAGVGQHPRDYEQYKPTVFCQVLSVKVGKVSHSFSFLGRKDNKREDQI